MASTRDRQDALSGEGVTGIEGKRAWVATEDFPPKVGGLSRWSENAAATLTALGVDVTVLAKKADPAEHDTLPYRVLGVRGRNFPKYRHLHFARAGRKLAEAEGTPDRLIALTWLVAEGFMRASLPYPVTVAVHGLEVFRPLSRRAFGRMERTLRAADRIVAASTFTAEKLAEMLPGVRPVSGINGVDLRLFSPQGERRPGDFPIQLLSVGRLVERKGFDKVIDVVRAARQTGLDAGVWIVGEGPLEEDLRARSVELGVDEYVIFLGNRGDRDLAVLYRSADLFVSPCRSDLETGDVEGFGLTFAEAAACGTASAALAEGGVTDAVEDGVSGILTRRDDFVGRTLELMGDIDRINEMGIRARERAERILDIEKTTRKLFPEG